MGSENKICFLFHSTHPRRVWRKYQKPLALSSRVSIHTPTKGVTQLTNFIVKYGYVSIHTPTKGVTPLVFYISNSLLVSIHTPTKGVTQLSKKVTFRFLFQSTHPRRVWPSSFFCFSANFWVSIHTPTKGVTCLKCSKTCLPRCFNPNTHDGCDSLFCISTQE